MLGFKLQLWWFMQIFHSSVDLSSRIDDTGYTKCGGVRENKMGINENMPYPQGFCEPRHLRKPSNKIAGDMGNI